MLIVMYRLIPKLLVASFISLLFLLIPNFEFLVIFPFIFLGYYLHKLSKEYGFAKIDEMDFPKFEINSKIKYYSILMFFLLVFVSLVDFTEISFFGIKISQLFSDSLLVLIPLISFFISFKHFNEYKASEKKILLGFFTTFFLLSFFAELIWWAYNFETGFIGEVPVGTYADIFWIFSYIPLFAFLGYQMGEKGYMINFKKTLFFLIVFAIFASSTIYSIILKIDLTQLNTLETSLNLFYPFIGILLFFLALFVFFTIEKSGVVFFISIFILSMSFSDFVYSILYIFNIFETFQLISSHMYLITYFFGFLAVISLEGVK